MRHHEKVHDDVIKWKHFPRNWPFVREIHRSPVNFPHKGQWRGALMFSLIYAWINDWVNNREAGDLRRQHGHYDVIVMSKWNMNHEASLSFFWRYAWRVVSYIYTGSKILLSRFGIFRSYFEFWKEFKSSFKSNKGRAYLFGNVMRGVFCFGGKMEMVLRLTHLIYLFKYWYNLLRDEQ